MNYLDSIAARAGSVDDQILLTEVYRSFREASERGLLNSQRAQELYELVRFCWFDAIAPWLRNERPALTRVLAFSKKCGATKVSDLLADALDGNPQPPVEFSLQVAGASQKLAVDAGDAVLFAGKNWGGTDIALSFAMTDFCKAVLQEVIASRSEFKLEAASGIQARSDRERMVDDRSSDGSAAHLFRQLVRGKSPRMEIGPWADRDDPPPRVVKTIALTHESNAPALEAQLTSLRARYGAVIDELLDIHSQFDGADLYVYEGTPAFQWVGISEWETLLDRAISWAEEVTWRGEKEEIPSCLYSAIAFGSIPGDNEVWLFITEGPHAGQIMLSDSDLIGDEPRFESLRQFVAAFQLDVTRVLNCSGHVQYHFADEESLFPIRYLADGCC